MKTENEEEEEQSGKEKIDRKGMLISRQLHNET
jgi:hypothetical protein